MAETGTLSAKQARFLAALLEHSSIRAACAACNIPERTAYHWLKQSDFVAAYREQQQAIYQANAHRLTRAMSKAIDTLEQNLDASSEFVQVQSAKAIIEHALQTAKVAELEQLLSQLEERLLQ